MKVKAKCSCGAALSVEYDTAVHRMMLDAQRADELLDKFRRDHRPCRISRAAKEAR